MHGVKGLSSCCICGNRCYSITGCVFCCISSSVRYQKVYGVYDVIINLRYLPHSGLHSLSAAVLSSTSVRLTWVAPCHTQQYHIHYRGTCGAYVDEGRLETDHQEHTCRLQEDINYSFTVNQTGFSGGRVFSTGPVYARTFTTGKYRYDNQVTT